MSKKYNVGGKNRLECIAIYICLYRVSRKIYQRTLINSTVFYLIVAAFTLKFLRKSFKYKKKRFKILEKGILVNKLLDYRIFKIKPLYLIYNNFIYIYIILYT